MEVSRGSGADAADGPAGGSRGTEYLAAESGVSGVTDSQGTGSRLEWWKRGG